VSLRKESFRERTAPRGARAPTLYHNFSQADGERGRRPRGPPLIVRTVLLMFTTFVSTFVKMQQKLGVKLL
jgi:hypothetical protein